MANSYTDNQIDEIQTPQPHKNIGKIPQTGSPKTLSDHEIRHKLGYTLPYKPGENWHGINLREWTSLEMAKKIVGNNIQIIVNNLKNEQLIKDVKKLDQDNSFIETAYNIVKTISIFGFMFVCITKMNGDVLWSFPKPYQTNSYVRYKKKIVEGTFLTHLGVGTKYKLMKRTTLKNNKLTVETLWMDDKFKNVIKVESKTETILNPKAEYIHLFKNYPVINPWETGYQEAYPDGLYVKSFQSFIDKTWNTLYTELQTNITRVHIKLTSHEISLLERSNPNYFDEFTNSGIIVVPSYDNAGMNMLNSWIEVQAGAPSLDIYMNALNETFDSYREAIGFTPKKHNKTSFRTASEVQYVKNTDSETILIKRNFLKKQFLHLVINSLIVLNNAYTYEELEMELDIFLHQVIAEDPTSILLEEKEKIALNLSNPIRAIMRLEHCNEATAINIFENNVKWLDKLKLDESDKTKIEKTLDLVLGRKDLNKGNEGKNNIVL